MSHPDDPLRFLHTHQLIWSEDEFDKEARVVRASVDLEYVTHVREVYDFQNEHVGDSLIEITSFGFADAIVLSHDYDAFCMMRDRWLVFSDGQSTLTNFRN